MQACGSNILNSLSLPITRSTWMRKAAICLEALTSSLLVGTLGETEGGRHFCL